MKITVYSKPSCVQCTATKRALAAKGLEYEEIDVTLDAAAYNTVVSLGYRQMPVVTVGDVNWCGYDPDQISKLVA